jgi:hypothetical protein
MHAWKSVRKRPRAISSDGHRKLAIERGRVKTHSDRSYCGNPRAVQPLLGHTKMDSTVRCRGVDVEDALSLSEGIDL